MNLPVQPFIYTIQTTERTTRNIFNVSECVSIFIYYTYARLLVFKNYTYI